MQLCKRRFQQLASPIIERRRRLWLAAIVNLHHRNPMKKHTSDQKNSGDQLQQKQKLDPAKTIAVSSKMTLATKQTQVNRLKQNFILIQAKLNYRSSKNE